MKMPPKVPALLKADPVYQTLELAELREAYRLQWVVAQLQTSSSPTVLMHTILYEVHEALKLHPEAQKVISAMMDANWRADPTHPVVEYEV